MVLLTVFCFQIGDASADNNTEFESEVLQLCNDFLMIDDTITSERSPPIDVYATAPSLI
jgi:hypothetical protein